MPIWGFGFRRHKDENKASEEEQTKDQAPQDQPGQAEVASAKVSDQDAPEPKEAVRGLWARGLSKTREKLSGALGRIFLGAKQMSPKLLEELEEALVLADVGFETVEKIVARVNEDLGRRELLSAESVRSSVKQAIVEILACGGARRPPSVTETSQRPYVCLVVGINGTGKTTTIAKLAWRYKQMGLSSVLVAGDTFRAAAIEQLCIWGERAGADVISHKEGSSPAAVVFDGIAAAIARQDDLVIVDTAGRLHTKKNLMSELAKIRRVAAANVAGAPHETLLVLDATCGQNAVAQAKQFDEWLEGITGIALAKIDGTAKGGVVVTIADELALPIQYLGTGEKLEDLVEFDARAFADALLG